MEIYPALSALLDRVTDLALLPWNLRGGTLIVRSEALRSLTISYPAIAESAGKAELPVRIERAPALERVRAESVWPSEAADLLAHLASDPNLPSTRAVEMLISGERSARWYPHPGSLGPVAERVRLALEAAVGAEVAARWRVEVVREAAPNGRNEHAPRPLGIIRAERRALLH